MIIIKKRGINEEYSSEKLIKSIDRANQRTGEVIDTNALAVYFYQIVEEKSFITTKQIDVIVCGLLYVHGYTKTLAAFMSYDDKDRS